MSGCQLDYPLVILMVGCIVLFVMLIKPGLEQIKVPPLVGFMILGFSIRLVDSHLHFFSAGDHEIFEFMSEIGLIALLFRVGLESNLQGLLAQLRRASIVWIGNVFISGLIGFWGSHYLLGFSGPTSLIIATAFTATSVGISVAVWEEAGALKTSKGELLVDVAEMDDISAVVFMAMLFSILPTLQHGTNTSVLSVASSVLILFLVKLFAFGTVCFLLSQYVEKHITIFFRSLGSSPDTMIVIVAIGFIIAAVADVLGFSLAIGAFFAGLVFSRDSETVKLESSFIPLYEFFSPFFFIGIGLGIDPQSIGTALGIGFVLLVMAIIAKLVANALPLLAIGSGLDSGILIGLSMVPRAEITMVIIQRGVGLGEWAVPANAYAAMVVVSIGTCIFSPLIVRALLKRKFEREEV